MKFAANGYVPFSTVHSKHVYEYYAQ